MGATNICEHLQNVLPLHLLRVETTTGSNINRNNMRVLIVNKFYYNRGGDCIHAMGLERLLQAAGCETAVFSMQYEGNAPSPYSRFFAPEVSFDGGLANKLKAMSRILGGAGVRKAFNAIVDDFRPDIVHFNNIHSYLSPAIVEMAKRRGLKTVWTLHDYKLLCPAYSCLNADGICERCISESKRNVVTHRCMKGSLASSIAGWIEAEYWNRRRLEAATDAFIAPSRFMAQKMTEGGFNADKLHTLCNFVNPDFISNLVAETDRRPYCVYVGRLSHEKGVATLIDAISSLPYALKLIGTGPLENELREKAQGKNIEFLGSLPPEEVRRHVAKARLLILPSEWYENNPLSIIEALCLGTPVVAARIGGIPELVRPSNGVLFRSGDTESLRNSIRNAWDLDFDYSNISAKAINEFNIDRYRNSLLNIYNNL